MIRAKVVGAGGYGGIGITELLLGHPEAELVSLASVSDVGKKISDVYPHLAGFCDKKIIAVDSPEATEPADVVFFSTPDGVGQTLARAALDQGCKVIDYSGDFRFNTAEAYADYAKRLGRDPEHKDADLLPEAVYGLGELHADELTPGTRLVGNPGCFAISCIIGLAPASQHHMFDPSSIVCDCKTGVSGAGKTPKPAFHFPARHDHMNAYRLTGHQHVCEVERELSRLWGDELMVTFTPQVVPTCRGIMSCLYATLNPGWTTERILEAYREFYAGRTFVRIYDRDAAVGTVHVRGTNYVNLIVDVDERTSRLRVISHIDNLVKGQAGNALQNMNLLFGLPEQCGLDRPGQYP